MQLKHRVIKRDVRIDCYRTAWTFGGFVFKPAFFEPCESGLDVFTKMTSVALAPAAFTVEALANTLAAVSYAILSAQRLCIFDLQDAQDDLLISGTFLLSSAQALLSAILSPMLNLVDLLVSGIKTLINGFADDKAYETIDFEQTRGRTLPYHRRCSR